MSQTRRPGFDGSYVTDRQRTDAWLVIDGYRFAIERDAAEAVLESGKAPIDASDLIGDIPFGGSILAGSALVRGAQDGPIYLFAVDRPDQRLHRIPNWESFRDFGFDLGKVLLVPPALLTPVPEGVEIWSARDRLARKGHSMYLPLLEVLD